MIKAVGAAIALAFGLAVAAPTARASDVAEEARAFVQTLADRVVAVAKNAGDLPADSVRAEFRALLSEGFDVPVIAQFVVGRFWRGATEDERAEFLRLFETMIVETYASQLTAYAGQAVSVVDSRVDSPKIAVVTTALERAEGEPFRLGWRVRTVDEMRIVDVIVEGVSLAQTQRAEYASVMKNNGGLGGLNALIAEKIAETEAARAASAESAPSDG